VRSLVKSAATLLFIIFPLILAAQQGGPPPPPEGRKPPGPRRGDRPPPGQKDDVFFKVQTLQAYEEKVDLLLEMGKIDAAIEELKKAQAVELPKGSPAYEMKCHLVGRMAKAYADAGRKAEALSTIQKLLADVLPGTPAEASAWLEAGSVYKKLKMNDEALKAFDKAIDLSKKLAQTGWRPPRPPDGEGGPPPPPGGRPAPGGKRP
jgi:tetratricopeptide (TPR) repeat protein